MFPNTQAGRDASVQAMLNRLAARDTQQIGAVNTIRPGGRVDYYGTPGEDFTRVESLSPRRRQAFDLGDQSRVLAADDALRRLVDFGGRRGPIDLAALGRTGRALTADRLPGVLPIDTQEVRRVEDEVFESGARQLRPEFDRRRDQLASTLANQGIAADTVAGQRASGRLDRSESQLLRDLAADSVRAGQAEHDRLARLQMARRSQEAGLSGQAFQETEALRRGNLDLQRLARTQEFNEIMSLLGAGSVDAPQFAPVPTPGVQAPNYLAAQAQAEQARQFQEQLGQQRRTQDRGFWSSLLGTVAPIAASFIPGIGPAAGAGLGAIMNAPRTGSGIPTFNPAQQYYGTR